jgi:hypothetical protein
MKSLILATAIAAVIAGPALAAPATKTVHHVRHERPLTDSNAFMTYDPIGVYVDGREIGRDPDPAIRSELSREYYIQQGD